MESLHGDVKNNLYVSMIPGLVEEGYISEDLVDRAVNHIMTLRFKAGLFDDPTD